MISTYGHNPYSLIEDECRGGYRYDLHSQQLLSLQLPVVHPALELHQKQSHLSRSFSRSKFAGQMNNAYDDDAASATGDAFAAVAADDDHHPIRYSRGCFALRGVSSLGPWSQMGRFSGVQEFLFLMEVAHPHLEL